MPYCTVGHLNIRISYSPLKKNSMSDVAYNTDSFPALVSTTSKLLQIGETPPVILLGYKERDEAERSLWNMMENIGVHLEMIGLRRGFADPPIEIWYGKYVPGHSQTT